MPKDDHDNPRMTGDENRGTTTVTTMPKGNIYINRHPLSNPVVQGGKPLMDFPNREAGLQAVEEFRKGLNAGSKAANKVEVIAKIKVGGQEFYGWSKEVPNPFTELTARPWHAEIDALSQAAVKVNTTGLDAEMWVTETVCSGQCLTSTHVKGNIPKAMRQMGLKTLTIHTPSETMILNQEGVIFHRTYVPHLPTSPIGPKGKTAISEPSDPSWKTPNNDARGNTPKTDTKGASEAMPEHAAKPGAKPSTAPSGKATPPSKPVVQSQASTTTTHNPRATSSTGAPASRLEARLNIVALVIEAIMQAGRTVYLIKNKQYKDAAVTAYDGTPIADSISTISGLLSIFQGDVSGGAKEIFRKPVQVVNTFVTAAEDVKDNPGTTAIGTILNGPLMINLYMSDKMVDEVRDWFQPKLFNALKATFQSRSYGPPIEITINGPLRAGPERREPLRAGPERRTPVDWGPKPGDR